MDLMDIVKTFSQISEITKIDEDSLDKILKGAMFKLSNVDEKVELWKPEIL